MEVLTASDRRVSVSVWIQNTKSCHAQNIKNRVENDILPGFLFLALSIRMARPPDRSRQKRVHNSFTFTDALRSANRSDRLNRELNRELNRTVTVREVQAFSRAFSRAFRKFN
jgi:hypothetical protein